MPKSAKPIYREDLPLLVAAGMQDPVPLPEGTVKSLLDLIASASAGPASPRNSGLILLRLYREITLVRLVTGGYSLGYEDAFPQNSEVVQHMKHHGLKHLLTTADHRPTREEIPEPAVARQIPRDLILDACLTSRWLGWDALKASAKSLWSLSGASPREALKRVAEAIEFSEKRGLLWGDGGTAPQRARFTELGLQALKEIPESKKVATRSAPITHLQGLALKETAEVVCEDDADEAKELKRQWLRLTGGRRLPCPIGKSVRHSQEDLYKPSDILDFLDRNQRVPGNDKHSCLKMLCDLQIRMRPKRRSV